jgi:hypothetical protein
MAAQSVKKADCVFGALYRRLKARLGPAQAMGRRRRTPSRAPSIALKYQVEYENLNLWSIRTLLEDKAPVFGGFVAEIRQL